LKKNYLPWLAGLRVGNIVVVVPAAAVAVDVLVWQW
jgi:hypothetical protein